MKNKTRPRKYYANITLGQYDPSEREIMVDYASHFWGDWKPTIFHEATHHFLDSNTNFGVFTAFFGYLAKYRLISKLTNTEIEHLLKSFKDAQFAVHEGIASFFGLRSITKERGHKAALKMEQDLPKVYQDALEPIRFALSMEDTLRDKFTSKIAVVSMNTSIANDLHEIDQFRNKELITEYFKDKNKNPSERMAIAAQAISKDYELLELQPDDICKEIGIEHCDFITIPQRVAMVNRILKLTDIPERATKKTIVSYENATDSMEHAFMTIQLVNLNLNLRDAPFFSDFAHLDLRKAKALFVFFERMLPQANQIFNDEEIIGKDTEGVFFFPKNEKAISLIQMESLWKASFFKDHLLTIMTDCSYYDWENDKPKAKYEQLNPDIVIYRNFNELKNLLALFVKKKLSFYYLSVAPTENHFFWTFFFKIKGRQTLHILQGIPVNQEWIYKSEAFKKGLNLESNFETLIDNAGKHYTNYCHCWLGLDERVDWYEFARDAEGYFPVLEKKIKGKSAKDA